jgi:hypothetical protein
MGPPERTASSGSASPQLDMALLRELAAEFGCYPASVKPEDIERTRARLAEHDRWCATAETSSFTCEQLAHSYPHLRRLVKNERYRPSTSPTCPRTASAAMSRSGSTSR